MENNYKRTERWLYHRSALIARIENLKREYKNKELEAEGEGIDYSKDKLCQTYKFNSTTENIAMALTQLNMMIESLQSRIDIMDRSLKTLSEDERKIVELKYFESQPWFNIAYEVKQSESTCKRHRKNAIEKLMFAIFGEE